MASESELPTVAEMLAGTSGELRRASKALGGAAEWLRSDWRPVGSALTDAQAAAKTAVYEQIAAAKRAINTAHNAIDRALVDAARTVGEDASEGRAR